MIIRSLKNILYIKLDVNHIICAGHFWVTQGVSHHSQFVDLHLLASVVHRPWL